MLHQILKLRIYIWLYMLKYKTSKVFNYINASLVLYPKIPSLLYPKSMMWLKPRNKIMLRIKPRNCKFSNGYQWHKRTFGIMVLQLPKDINKCILCSEIHKAEGVNNCSSQSRLYFNEIVTKLICLSCDYKKWKSSEKHVVKLKL
jgi:hypothetical protein